jgi:hypothetical protein
MCVEFADHHAFLCEFNMAELYKLKAYGMLYTWRMHVLYICTIVVNNERLYVYIRTPPREVMQHYPMKICLTIHFLLFE